MPQKTMLKKSDELPHEKDFAAALAKAKENNGSYDCIIGGSVYSFYKNAIKWYPFEIREEVKNG